MAAKTYRVVYYIEDEDGVAITSGNSPIAFRDADQSQSWITGTHLANGLWVFELPSGWSSGFEVAVNTSGSSYTRDTNLSGGAGATSGFMLAPVDMVEA